jgi:glycerol dehydrogenase-like iron-containing ADH family enzyme
MTKGAGVLARESTAWSEFAVLTTASPWAVARPMLARPASRLLLVESLERDHLDALARSAAGVSLVVGLGGGMALDGAKHVAWRTGARLVQVPSSAANNACFTRRWRCLVNGRRGPVQDGPLPDQLLVDTELVLRAPPRRNRAGVGEIVCSHTALVDWALAHRAGLAVDWDESLAEWTRRELRGLERLAPAVGADDPGAFVAILETEERFAPHFLAYPRARFNGGSEHLFAWCLEERAGRRVLHSEAVSLGVLLMAHMQRNAPEWAAGILQAARVAFQPEAIGTRWPEVEEVVLALPAYAREVVPYHTVINELASDPDGGRRLRAALAEARAFVQGLG